MRMMICHFNIMGTRICTKCGEEKPETTEYFHRAKNCRGGLCTICKECRNKAVRRWRAENPERVRETVRRWQAENPEKARGIRKRWEAENPEKAREARKRWESENPEKAREAVRRWYAENPEKVRETHRRYANTLVPNYLKNLIASKYNIDRSEIGEELLVAKRRELKYYRQLKQLKK